MSGPRLDLEFAFNDIVFSDRVLRIEVVADSFDSDSDGLSYAPTSKRQRIGDQPAHSYGSECSTVVRKVETLFLSSPILAANSPFFYKLFTNGMRESHENHVTLRINVSEEEALIDLLKFTYKNTLSASTAADLLKVLIVADKFEVVSCMTYCSERLQQLPMSLESALLYLELPSNVLMAEPIQPLKNAATVYIVERYKDLINQESLEKEMLTLPLSAVMAVLGSDRPSVREDWIFGFILMWVRANYTELEERREILTNGLLQLIRFPHMSYPLLISVLKNPEFDLKQVSKLVFEALSLKDGIKQKETPKHQCLTKRPIKVVHFEFSRPKCVVYFDLKKEECETLSSGPGYSDKFELGGHMCLLVGVRNKDRVSSSRSHYFGLCVIMVNPGKSMIDLEYAVMKKPVEEFETKYKVYKCSAMHRYLFRKTECSDCLIGRRTYLESRGQRS